uniref:Uncharacterized protein n=1 Tax=Ditylenchus dipsaci TaxID=166011 RepID=A0A915DFK6_9BILA
MLNHNMNQNATGLFNAGSTSNIFSQVTPGSKNLLELSLLAQHYYNQLGSNAGGHPGTLQPPTLKPSVSHGGNSDGESSPRSYDHPSPPNRKTSLSNFSTDSILGLNHSFEHQNQQVSGPGGSQEHVLDLSGCSGQTNNQGQCSQLSSSSNQDMEVDDEQIRSSNHKDGPEMGQPPGDSLLMIAGSRRIHQESYQNHQKDPLALNLASEEPSQKSELTL